MIWIARYNAVMSIIAVVGIIIFWAASGPMDAIAFLLFMLFLNERRKQASDDSVIDDEDV